MSITVAQGKVQGVSISRSAASTVLRLYEYHQAVKDARNCRDALPEKCESHASSRLQQIPTKNMHGRIRDFSAVNQDDYCSLCLLPGSTLSTCLWSFCQIEPVQAWACHIRLDNRLQVQSSRTPYIQYSTSTRMICERPSAWNGCAPIITEICCPGEPAVQSFGWAAPSRVFLQLHVERLDPRDYEHHCIWLGGPKRPTSQP